MIDKKHIRIGFFEDFKGEDIILISVDIHGLLELESVFLKLTEKDISVQLSNLESIDKEHQLPIALNSKEKDEGLTRIDDNYYWNLTSEKWKEIREKVTALYKNGTIGHQYLDSDSSGNSDLQIILALNEYDKSFWEKFNMKK